MEEEKKDSVLELDNLADLEEATPDLKEDKDNSEKSIDQEPKAEEEKKIDPTLEAKKKRDAEKKAGEREEALRLRSMVIDLEVERASTDARNLLELAKKDPKLADEVARRFGFDDFKDAKSSIVGEQIGNKTRTDEDREAYYQQRKAKEDHEVAVNEAKSLLEKLPADVQEDAIDEFNELIEGKILTREKALKIANMITLSLVKGKPKTDVTDGLKKLNSTGISTSKKPDDEGQDKLVIVNGRMVLLNSKNNK